MPVIVHTAVSHFPPVQTEYKKVKEHYKVLKISYEKVRYTVCKRVLVACSICLRFVA